MNTWKVILATMVIFGTGVVTGGLLVRHSEGIRPAHLQHSPGQVRPGQPPSAGGMRLDFLRRAQRDLDLTPEQREQIDKIIKESQEHTRKLMAPVLQRTREEFLDVLTPEQRARFELLVKQEQQQRQREQHRPPTPREHPAAGAVPTNAP